MNATHSRYKHCTRSLQYHTQRYTSAGKTFSDLHSNCMASYATFSVSIRLYNPKHTDFTFPAPLQTQIRQINASKFRCTLRRRDGGVVALSDAASVASVRRRDAAPSTRRLTQTPRRRGRQRPRRCVEERGVSASRRLASCGANPCCCN